MVLRFSYFAIRAPKLSWLGLRLDLFPVEVNTFLHRLRPFMVQFF
jgi:hypothetical protein